MNQATEIISQLRMLAAYHGWATGLLASHIAKLTDEHYFAPAGLPFDSIHGTLNHLLLGDKNWYGRFIGKPETYASLAQEIEPDRHALIKQLAGRQELWRELIDSTDEHTRSGDLRYTTTAGSPATAPWTGALTHVFNHATHHRGQITAVLTRYGYPCPELDLIYFLQA